MTDEKKPTRTTRRRAPATRKPAPPKPKPETAPEPKEDVNKHTCLQCVHHGINRYPEGDINQNRCIKREMLMHPATTACPEFEERADE